MEDGRGNLEEIPYEIFEKAERHRKESGVFQVGEIVSVKGSLFKVKSIFPQRINLKPVPNTPENQANCSVG